MASTTSHARSSSAAVRIRGFVGRRNLRRAMRQIDASAPLRHSDTLKRELREIALRDLGCC